MKVKKEEIKAFTPITIILETEKEAEIMWYRLNKPSGELKCTDEDNVNYKMWEEYDDIFRPERERD